VAWSLLKFWSHIRDFSFLSSDGYKNGWAAMASQILMVTETD
jgi:hypothetical protein